MREPLGWPNQSLKQLAQERGWAQTPCEKVGRRERMVDDKNYLHHR